MTDNIDFTLLNDQFAKLAQENQALRARVSRSLDINLVEDTFKSMDVVTYRLDQSEKRSDASDARMVRIEDKLNAIQLTLAGLATKDSIRNWGLAITAIVIATGIAMGAMLVQSSGNQLSAFQAGLGAIQTVIAAHDVPPAAPKAP